MVAYETGRSRMYDTPNSSLAQPSRLGVINCDEPVATWSAMQNASEYLAINDIHQRRAVP